MEEFKRRLLWKLTALEYGYFENQEDRDKAYQEIREFIKGTQSWTTVTGS